MHSDKVDLAARAVAQEPLEISEGGAGGAGVGDGGGADLQAGLVAVVVGGVDEGVGEGLDEGFVGGDGAGDGHAGGLGGGAEVRFVEGEEGVGALWGGGVVSWKLIRGGWMGMGERDGGGGF